MSPASRALLLALTALTALVAATACGPRASASKALGSSSAAPFPSAAPSAAAGTSFASPAPATSAVPALAAARLVFPPEGSTHTAKRSVDRIGWASLAPDGATLITLGVGNVVHRWDLAAGKLLGLTDPPGPRGNERNGAVVALPGGEYARCDGKALTIYKTSDGTLVRELPPAKLPCGPLYATEDGKILFVTNTKGGIDLVDAISGEVRRSLKVDDGYTTVVPSPDGAHAVTLDNANNAVIWDLATGTKRPLARQSFVGSAGFSPDSKDIVTLGRPSDRAIVKVLAVSDLSERARLFVPPLARSFAYPGAPDSALAIGGGSSGDGFLLFATREPLAPIKTQKLPSPPETLHPSRTTAALVTVSYEAFIRVFDSRTGELRGSIVPAK